MSEIDPQLLPGKALPLMSGMPLWQVVPTRDENGCPLNDFMILIPGLRKKPPCQIEFIAGNIQAVLGHYQEVVFANMNLQINLLWVSLKNKPGLMLEVAAAIKLRVPEAVLIAQKPNF